MKNGIPNIIDPDQVGASWPAAVPAEDPVLFGRAELTPAGAFQVRSFQTFTLVYTVGRFGLDDNGSIRVVFRFFGDWGGLQTTDQKAENYVTAITSTGQKPGLEFNRIGHSRPWMKSLTVRISGGFLSEGDTVTITFGDTSGGSPGFKMQTFVESAMEFKVLADPCAVGHYVPIIDNPAVSIIPGPPAIWRAVLPTLRRPGEVFRLGIKAEDEWGNPTPFAQAFLKLEATAQVDGLPEAIDYGPEQKSIILDNLKMDQEGELRIRIINGATGDQIAEAGPLIIRDGDASGYWGDLHGQSGETIGVTSAEEYFDFARNLAFLDVTSHQANDFQVNNAFWDYLNRLTKKNHQDGRFVTFPGYEWSGNTSVGGDRNVFFREEGRQIRRSSHALLPDRSDIGTDSNDARLLFEDLAEEDCVIYAHVGGRYADITFAHDAKLETAMEVHSAWGTFEWMLTDGFALGHRCGVVCNSDGHKGRPGASYPGASMFGAYGGLTCFYTDKLTRDGIWEALHKRHHFGTTGNRLHLDVRAEFETAGYLHDKDPKAFDDVVTTEVKNAMMGDIVQTSDDTVTLQLEVASGTPIERIEIRNGVETIHLLRGYDEADLGSRIRVLWSGAEYRGRGRNTSWKGHAKLTDAKIERMEKINAWNHEKLLEVDSRDCVVFDAITTGNYGGFDIWLSDAENGGLSIETNHGTLTCLLGDIGVDDQVLDCGGLERKLRAFRLPDKYDCRNITHKLAVDLKLKGDNPLWACVTTEDGYQAWSSPIFVYRE